jgi:parvulin-like peptidyl-prolyl isomerase
MRQMMKNRTIGKAVALFLTIALVVGVFAGCGEKEKTDRGELLAEVGDEKIYYNDSEDFAKTLLLLDNSYTWDMIPEEEIPDLVKRSALNVMIDDLIIRDYMKKEDVITDDAKEQIKTGLENIKADETLGAQIETIGITDELIEEYFKFYFYTQAFMEKVDKDDPVTDEEVQKYFDENKDDPEQVELFTAPESISVSHILIEDPEYGDEAKAKIEEALKKAKNGEDFAALAKEYSDSDDAEDGGDLGEIYFDGSMDAAFEEAAFGLKNGEISDVIETEDGFEIIKALSDVNPERARTVDEARDEIVTYIQDEHIEKLLTELREKAKVKYVNGLKADDESLVPAEEEELDISEDGDIILDEEDGDIIIEEEEETPADGDASEDESSVG